MEEIETYITLFPKKQATAMATLSVEITQESLKELGGIRKLPAIIENKISFGQEIDFFIHNCHPKTAKIILRVANQYNAHIRVWSNELNYHDYLVAPENTTITINSMKDYQRIKHIHRPIKLAVRQEAIDSIYPFIKNNKYMKLNSIIVNDLFAINEDAIRRYNPERIDIIDGTGYVGEKETYTVKEYINMNKMAQQYLMQINNNMTDVEKFLRLYNLLGENVRYDYNELYYVNDIYNNNMYGALAKGKSVCEGIAKTMQELLELVGIPTEMEIGKLNQSFHAWNRVKLNGKWYYCDMTNDCSAIQNGQTPNFCLLSIKSMKEKFYEITEEDNDIEEDFDQNKIKEYFKSDRNIIADSITSDNLSPEEAAGLLDKISKGYASTIYVQLFRKDEEHYGMRIERLLSNGFMKKVSTETPTIEKNKRGEFLRCYNQTLGIRFAKKNAIVGPNMVIRFKNERKQSQETPEDPIRLTEEEPEL